MDYIKPIKEQLDENMHVICKDFLFENRSISWTPRYYNFEDFDRETKELTIQSTQRNWLKFKVITEFDFIDVIEFWNQFKEYRTMFLQENYPEINPY